MASNGDYLSIDVVNQDKVDTVAEEDASHYANMDTLNESLVTPPSPPLFSRNVVALFTAFGVVCVLGLVGCAAVVSHGHGSSSQLKAMLGESDDRANLASPFFAEMAVADVIDRYWNELAAELDIYLQKNQQVINDFAAVLSGVLEKIAGTVERVAEDPAVSDADVFASVTSFIRDITDAIKTLAPPSFELPKGESSQDLVSACVDGILKDIAVKLEAKRDAEPIPIPKRVHSVFPEPLRLVLHDTMQSLHTQLIRNNISYVSAAVMVETLTNQIEAGAGLVAENLPKSFSSEGVESALNGFADRVLTAVQNVTAELEKGESEITRVWKETKGDAKQTVSSMLQGLADRMTSLARIAELP